MMNARIRFLSAAVIAASAAVAVLPATAHGESVAIANDSVDQIFSRHAAYAGHPEGLVLKYRFKPPAPKASPKPTPSAGPDEPTFPDRFETTYRRGALYRTVTEAGGVTQQSGFTGRSFWSANYNGYTVVAYENAARFRLTGNLIEADQLDASLEPRSRPAETIDGKPVDVVRISPPAGIPADIAFDRATGAYVQITTDPEKKYGEHSVVHIDGYAEAGPNVHVPKGYHFGDAADSGRWELAEQTVRAVTNADLRGPVPTASWAFKSTDTEPIDIVERSSTYSRGLQSGAVHVHASIGGHAGTFLLDSGAAGIILFKPYADKIKYTKLGRTGFVGINGSGVGARFVKLADSIDVGKNSLSNVIVTVQDGKGFGEVDGIVGYDFLAGALVDVDLAARTIRILDPSTMQPVVAQGAYAFTVNLANRTPQIVVKAAGAPARPTIDTGNSSWIILSYAMIDDGRVVALPHDYRGFAGVDGVIGARCSKLSLVEVGPYKYERAETCFAGGSFGLDGGLIGYDFLKHFNWTFDYAESKLVLTPNGK
jgi:predicted aspartyl protease